MAKLVTDRERQSRIDRARWWALQNQPFYGQLAMRLSDVLVDAVMSAWGPLETAGTDGSAIAWSRGFLDRLETEELRFVLLHETMHPAHGHLWRLPHDEDGNLAGDFAINARLRQIAGVKMPTGGAYSPRFDGMAEEEILKALRARPKRKSQGVGHGEGSVEACGVYEQPAPQGAQTQAQAQQASREKWEGAVRQAALGAGVGNVPAEFQRLLAAMDATHVSWEDELQDFVHQVVTEYRNDWSHSARRHAWQHVIYPRKHSRHQLARVAFFRDTSGSVSNAQCALFTAEITAAMEATGCSAYVADIDTDIQKDYWLEPGDSCPLSASGAGGTDFRPAFARVQALIDGGEDIAGIVYCTDMQPCSWPPDPGIATLWVSVGHGTKAPFGRVVEV